MGDTSAGANGAAPWARGVGSPMNRLLQMERRRAGKKGCAPSRGAPARPVTAWRPVAPSAWPQAAARSWNCSSSVEPFSAVVEDWPCWIAWVTWSK